MAFTPEKASKCCRSAGSEQILPKLALNSSVRFISFRVLKPTFCNRPDLVVPECRRICPVMTQFLRSTNVGFSRPAFHASPASADDCKHMLIWVEPKHVEQVTRAVTNPVSPRRQPPISPDRWFFDANAISWQVSPRSQGLTVCACNPAPVWWSRPGRHSAHQENWSAP